MDSLSRPFHRRKPSNAYDGVFSGHRPGAPAVNVDEYREIFSTTGSSIPVIDLNKMEESASGELKPDYSGIFGGFRDLNIAVSYQELLARDKARAPSSTTRTSQDPGDMSHESSDAMKQFNLSYNKISQRSKDGLDGTTHVTQLHAVPGFTCFVDESTSQPNKETVKQKASSSNDSKLHPSKVSSSPESKKEVKKQKPPATSQPKKETKKQASQTAVESQSRNGRDEAVSDNKNFTFHADFKSYPSNVASSSAPHATNLDNYKNAQKRSTTTNVELPPPCFGEEVAVDSAAAALKKAIENAQESIRIAKESVGRKKEGFKRFSSKSFKDSLKVKSRVTNVNTEEDRKEKDHKNGNFYDGEKLFGVKKVINETRLKDSEPVKNSGIPIMSRLWDNNKTVCNSKQVVGERVTKSVENNDHKNGNFYDGENLFGAKKVINEEHAKVSEPVKSLETPITPRFELNDSKTLSNPKQVVGETVTESVENKDHKNGNFYDGEMLFGAREVIDETHVKVSEPVKNIEIPIASRLLDNNKTVCNSKLVGETEIESVENNACENPRKDDEGPDGFLELEGCERKQEDTESNNLTVCQKVETKKEILQTTYQNGYEKKSCEESFGLLESNIQENLEQEHDESEEEKQVEEDRGVESHSEEERFYDVYEAETIKNAHTYVNNIETNNSSQKEDYENCEAEETYENSSSDYDDAEENENVIGESNILDDTENACKVDQNVDQAENCQDIDDVSLHHELQVEEKVAYENFSSDETEEKTIHCMEIEVKKTVAKEDNNPQQPHEQTPVIKTEMDTGPPQEPKNVCREPDLPEPNREMEQVRIKLAVERAIREARERAFAEVRQRVIADTQEKVAKTSTDKTAAQSKLRSERALVERATAEARQRALEKLEKQTSFTSQTNTESALRSKAKLEKHNRIMERAAKALAEKEKRDLLTRREQAERNRLAEHLDADVKRWSTGKEGNLRALLSTLQYILGADSGWQAVSLTDIITTGAVKKAYRKATLCVHPDKLQQRGASIQQKYICEKVFDLLKAAWNRFNSEER
ncbi:uncharacterized protein LOC143543710 [Bidens hawaiensis]|uniref:uncharacterized protein LOC143543710 n=1 Tax=Bidens hawaiensis TaxID=980011 RepID=UPI0040490782